MIVAGGTYRERCVTPFADLLFGSGGRAALALRNLERVRLHTFHPDPDDVAANFGPDATVHSAPFEIAFDYLHPLGAPRIAPYPVVPLGSRQVEGDMAIRFGCLEGDFSVKAGAAVYDPQSGGAPRPFAENGSRADRLAVVLNAAEARRLSGHVDLDRAGRHLLESERAEVIVVKRGADGATVFDRSASPTTVPAYRTRAIFKIGSGDVFTAAFAHYWMSRGLSSVESADLASKQVAAYVATRTLPCAALPPELEPVEGGLEGLVVGLAFDDRQTRTRWLVHEVRAALRMLGARDVVTARDGTAHDILFAMPAAAEGVAMEALGDAVARRRPVVVFADDGEVAAAARARGADPISDFAASLYAVAWTSDEGASLLRRR